MIKKNVFETTRQLMYHGRPFADKQLEFMEYALDTINTDKDTDKITVFSARCGLGKSTFLQVLIQSWLKEEKDEGLIIVTDNLERLSSFSNGDDRIAYLTAENKSSEIVRQMKCPVLLMSTQRYFQMQSIDRLLECQINGVPCRRNTIIFDEAPYFYQSGEIRIDELNYLHSAIESISDKCNSEDKAWIVAQYNSFREYMIGVIKNLECERPKTTYLFWNDSKRNSITEDDKRFYNILRSNMSDIKMNYPKVESILHNLSLLMEQGSIFKSIKTHDSDSYSKGFIITENLHNKFITGGCVKTFIFDATAKYSEMYPQDAEWLNMLECEDFNVSLDWMHIHLVDVNTTRNAIFNQKDSRDKINAIKNHISSLGLDTDDTLLVSYKSLIDNKRFEDIGYNEKNTLYFGNTKGFNAHAEKHNFIQVGYNRQTDINYLNLLLSNNEDFDKKLKRDIAGLDDNIVAFDTLLKDDIVDGYMSAEIVVDIIQNVFRTKAREITNTENVEVYLYIKNTKNIMKELQYAFAKYGATITVESIEQIQIAKILNRNTKKQTNAQKIVEWLDSLSTGQEFTSDEMLDALNLSQSQFNKTKEKNVLLATMFKEMRISKNVYRKK